MRNYYFAKHEIEPLQTKESECQLDKEWFACGECKDSFRHTEGTWLPVAINIPRPIVTLSKPDVMPLILGLWKCPEVITSDDFTCYDCITSIKGEEAIELLKTAGL